MIKIREKSWIGGVLSALAASLCCIAPLLAVFGGIGGAATWFNWLEPFRPYLMGLTVLVFAFAWYQQLVAQPRKQEACCEPVKRSFWQTKKFLLIVTLFAGVMMAFPVYSSLFYKAPKQVVNNQPTASFTYVRLNIKGMGCADCTKHIDVALTNLIGVASSVTSFEKAQTLVRFDPAKTNADSISHRISAIGYQPTLLSNN